MGFFTPFFIGGALALVLDMPMSFLEDRLPGRSARVRRCAALGISVLLVGGGLVLLVALLLPRLGRTLTELAQTLPAALGQLQSTAQDWLRGYPLLADWLPHLTPDFSALGGWLSGGVLGGTMDAAARLAGGTVDLILGLVMACYLLARKEQSSRRVRLLLHAWLPLRWERLLRHLLRLTRDTFRAFLCGQCVEALILGLLFAAVLFLARMPYAGLIGVVIGLTAVVPIFGSFVGCAVGVVLILPRSPVRAAWFIVIFLCLQQLEGSLIYPRVVGRRVGLSPLWVLAAVTLGGRLFGVAGILLMIPLFSVAWSFAAELTHARLLKRKKET